MSNKSPYSNYNKISLKTDSMVELIHELSKLGVFKGKPKPRAKKTAESVRQTGDMPPGYAKDIMRNIPPIQQIDPGMTAQQIEDIQQSNDATIAELKAEIQQGRIQDIQNVGQALFSIVNPRRERFRSQQGADAGVYDPFNQPQSGFELLPDVQDVPFDQTLNEGGPDVEAQIQQTIFPVEETGNISTRLPGLQPRQPIGKKVVLPSLRAEIVSGLGLAPVPKQKGSSAVDLKQYYTSLVNVTERPINENIRSKEALFNEIYRIIDEEGSSV